MTISQQLEKVQLLIGQKRSSTAEKLLLDILAEQADNTYALWMLAEIKLQEDNFIESLRIIQQAISYDPDKSILYFYKGRVEVCMDRFADAEKSLEQAIELDPNEDDAFALLAQIRLVRKAYNDALELANHALSLNAKNLLALNIRSQALTKLKMHEEAADTMDGALHEDPNDAYTHANYGWIALERGDHKAALNHFKEALKLDPNSAIAQSGMGQALKAKYLIFRWFLSYSFWLSNLSQNMQWGFIIGFYVGYRILKGIADNSPELAPFLMPILIVLGIIAFSTWVISPLTNLLFRLNPYGRHLLTKDEKMSSNFVGISLISSFVGIVGYYSLGNIGFLALAGFGFTMMLPLGVMFSAKKSRMILVGYTIGLLSVGSFAVYNSIIEAEFFNQFTAIYLMGLFIFQWVANYLLIRENNH